MILYHITKRKHIPSIQVKGIIPGFRRGLFTGKIKLKKVYLTNNVQYVINNQAGQKWCDRWDPIVLEIDIETAESLKIRCSGTYTLSLFEFVTDKIKPEQIKRIRKLKDILRFQKTYSYAQQFTDHLATINIKNKLINDVKNRKTGNSGL